jgi:ABC-type Fe3+/spermidine/putrescine transport system ATPase subunit
VIQHGPAAEIFERPRDAFVAAFVGFENVLTGRVEDRSGDYVRIAVADRIIHSRRPSDDWNGRRVAVCIRAENVKLHLGEPGPADQAAGSKRLRGRIAAVTNLGPLTKVIVDCGFTLAAYVMSGEIRGCGFVPNTAVEAAIDAEAVHLALEA